MASAQSVEFVIPQQYLDCWTVSQVSLYLNSSRKYCSSPNLIVEITVSATVNLEGFLLLKKEVEEIFHLNETELKETTA